MSTLPADAYSDLAPAVLAPTRADIERLLDGLNPQQRAAVVHEGSPLLVVAGAGSGKTKVLTTRIGYLLAARGVQPGEVLAITFTNKAAGEMKERVAALVGGRARAGSWNGMWVSTFHSACVRILRAEAKKLGFTPSFSIYDQADAQRLMTLVCRDLDLDPKRFPARAMSNHVSDLKNELLDWESAKAKATSVVEQQVAEVYAAYQARLREANALDFDDLIMTTVDLLQAFPDVAEHYRRRFRHVLVDEYQDTNHAQYTLVRELVGASVGRERGGASSSVPTAELCVVGDAGQAAVDRLGRRRAGRWLRRRQRARRGGLRRRGGRPPRRRVRRQARRRGGVLPDQRAVPCVRGDLRPGRAALPRRRWRALLRAQGGP